MKAILLSILILKNLYIRVHCGQELLRGYDLKEYDLQPNQLLIIQFDSRPLSSDSSFNYWNVTANYNNYYCQYHKHQYQYLTFDKVSNCSYAHFTLSDAWCKVKAMLWADEFMYNNNMIKAVLYIDSDIVITTNYSLSIVIGYMRQSLQWDIRKKPIAFNQDGPGWACKFTREKVGYDFCLNSGTVLWFKSSISSLILNNWWHSAGDSYSLSKFPTKWRTKWPWEQGPMHKIYAANQNRIMRLSFPKEPFLPWGSTADPKSQYPTDTVEPFCFSHWPGANCFLTHHCASNNQKKKLIEKYQILQFYPLQISYINYSNEKSKHL